MNCERCHENTDFLHGLGSMYSKEKPKKSLLMVCRRCFKEWCNFLHGELRKRNMVMGNYVHDDKNKLWLKIFKEWCKTNHKDKEKVIFT